VADVFNALGSFLKLALRSCRSAQLGRLNDLPFRSFFLCLSDSIKDSPLFGRNEPIRWGQRCDAQAQAAGEAEGRQEAHAPPGSRLAAIRDRQGRHSPGGVHRGAEGRCVSHQPSTFTLARKFEKVRRLPVRAKLHLPFLVMQVRPSLIPGWQRQTGARTSKVDL